ncbi:syncoilin [Lampris incognitus]|uniref:syncoilin n=1 Tax=Lampris incognitus TaxID=2546036 RepID=UPI0024B48577|nr:syncoilin [Lampris incognitus]
MEDQWNSTTSTGFEPLFIQEENEEPERIQMEDRGERGAAQPGVNGVNTRTHLNPSAQIQPYLREMDDLLKSCEELTGVSFGMDFSPGYTDTCLDGSTRGQFEEEVTNDRGRESQTSPQPYLSTTYIDTSVDKTVTADHPDQAGSLMDTCGGTTETSPWTEMPLTSAGTKLSSSMAEYQNQLLGMLAMLESSMEDGGMDCDFQEWDTDANQEYVQVCQNHTLQRKTTLRSMERSGTMGLDVPPLLRSWVGPTVDGATGQEWMESRDGEIALTTQAGPLKPCVGYEGMRNVSAERLDTAETKTRACEEFQVDEGVLEPQLRLSGLHKRRMSGDDEIHTKGEMYGIDIGNAKLPAEDGLTVCTDQLETLGCQFEDRIKEVQSLELKREELLEELLTLRGEKEERRETKRSKEEEEKEEEKGRTEERSERKVAELMEALKEEEKARREERQQEVQSLREQRAEEEKKLWKVNLERQGLHEETRRLKRRLFAIARDCAHSQAALNCQQRELEQFKREEDKLKSLVLQLTEEDSQLRSAQREQLSSLQGRLHVQASSQTSSTQEELTQCRRHSCGDIEQYLHGGLKALEERYEPMLLALLKRREATSGALVKAREQAQELRAQLGPLRQESQQLALQRACLDEKLKLLQIQRKENVAQYKETVYSLEENSRELKTELKIQKKKTKEMEVLKDNLTKQLTFYRAAIKDHNSNDHEEKT